MLNRVIIAASTLVLIGSIVGAQAQARSSTLAGVKTAGACNDEYKVNKGALKDVKEKKKDFIVACRALAPGTPTPIGSAPSTPTPPASTQSPASRQSAAPGLAPSAGAPAPTSPAAPVPSARRTPAPGESACGNGYAHLSAKHAAGQFCDEGQAKARCAGQPVVWVNTKSKIYHVAGSNTYGHTKEGAYMCKTDADAEGNRASKNGH